MPLKSVVCPKVLLEFFAAAATAAEYLVDFRHNAHYSKFSAAGAPLENDATEMVEVVRLVFGDGDATPTNAIDRILG